MDSKKFKRFIREINAPDLARVTHRNLGAATRDQKALLRLIERVEERAAMLGFKLIFDHDRQYNEEKYKAWVALYGHEKQPAVSWPAFAEKYAYGRTEDGEYLAFVLP